MKKLSLSLALVFAVLLINPYNVIAQKTQSFNEQFTHTPEDFPTTTVINRCTGESVVLDGSIHVVLHGVINSNKLSLGLHANFQNLTGESLSGRNYAGGGAANGHLNASFNGAFNGHLVASTVLTTSGNNNNIILKLLLHVTINSNGNVTATVAEATAECK